MTDDGHDWRRKVLEELIRIRFRLGFIVFMLVIAFMLGACAALVFWVEVDTVGVSVSDLGAYAGPGYA